MYLIREITFMNEIQSRKGVNSAWYHVIAVFVVMIWGVTFVSSKLLINNGLNPTDIFFYRFLIAYLGILAFSHKRLFADHWRDELDLCITGVMGGSLYFVTENMALKYSMASNVALIVCSAPLLTSLIVGVFYKSERLNKRQVGASFLAFIGMILVVLNGQFILKLNPLGDFLAFVSAITWALYSLFTRKVGLKYSSLFLTRKLFFYGLLTSLPVFFYFPLETNTELLFQPIVLFNLLFLGVLASLICFLLWTIVLKRIGAVRVTNYVYLNPLITLVASTFLLGEKITPITLGGTALLLTGVILVERWK